jgi:hypothetical protein
MLTSLNQMLSRMDALVLDRRCLRAEEGVHETPSLEEDETRMLLQMPKSDLSSAYKLNSDEKTWDYKIVCDDGDVPINRFFACLLFEPIKTKVLSTDWNNTPEGFRMLRVNKDELCGLIEIGFEKGPVSVTKRGLVRCAEIANAYRFWEPTRLFLDQSIDHELSIQVQMIEEEIREKERTITEPYMSNVTPKRGPPRRYAFSTKAVQWVEEGEIYGQLNRQIYYKLVVSAETIHHRPSANVHVLARAYHQIGMAPEIVPMTRLHSLLNFDDVTAKVGYPVYGRMREGESLKDITKGMEPQLVGKFYVYYDTFRQTNLEYITERLIVFLLGFNMDCRKAYIFRTQRDGVLILDSNQLHIIEEGEGATDEDTLKRANVIVNADPIYLRYVFGNTPCTNITQLTIGTYCHYSYEALVGDDPMTKTFERDCVDESRRRIPVLYLGPAPEGKAYIFGCDREVIVNVENLYPQVEG